MLWENRPCVKRMRKCARAQDKGKKREEEACAPICDRENCSVEMLKFYSKVMKKPDDFLEEECKKTKEAEN